MPLPGSRVQGFPQGFRRGQKILVDLLLRVLVLGKRFLLDSLLRVFRLGEKVLAGFTPWGFRLWQRFPLDSLLRVFVFESRV